MIRYLLIAVSSLALLLLMAPLGIINLGGHPLKFTVANIAYCLFTYYLLRNTPDASARFKVTGMIMLPVLIACIPHALNLNATLYALPSTIAHFTGIGAGILLVHLTSYRRITFLYLFLIGSLWVTTSGYVSWGNKVFYGSYSGSVNEKILPFTLVTADGQTVSSTSMKGKYVVFDFWNTGCGVCFRKFPQLQQYHTRYQKNENVKFFAVNIPMTRDKPGQATTVLAKKGYTFPTLFAESQSLASLFKVNSFPTVVIMDPSQHVIYRGQLDGIDNSLRELAEIR